DGGGIAVSDTFRLMVAAVNPPPALPGPTDPGVPAGAPAPAPVTTPLPGVAPAGAQTSGEGSVPVFAADSGDADGGFEPLHPVDTRIADEDSRGARTANAFPGDSGIDSP